MSTGVGNENNNYIFNIGLAKLTGLYQILHPGTVKFRGRNVYHVVAACVLTYTCVVAMLLNLNGLYYWTANIPMSIDYFWKAESALYIVYKTWCLVRHSDDIWDCLSITRYGFTSFGLRNRHLLDRWRQRLLWMTTVYVCMYTSPPVVYAVGTLAFSADKLPVKNPDGSVGYYRQNVLNLYFMVSDETYNAHYNTFYFVETLFLVTVTMAFLVCDTLLVTLCYVLGCQMQIICSAFESVGHKSLRDPHRFPIVNTEEEKSGSNEHDLIYDELKTIIMDHQAVMKKYEDFLTIFERVILLQVFVLLSSLIVVWFCFIMKDSIIFVLYSSNWTEMDMKCKKLILLTMKMNNAYNKKLKFTRTRLVNLEMFFKTMGNCYTILSVLINYMKSKYE